MNYQNDKKLLLLKRDKHGNHLLTLNLMHDQIKRINVLSEKEVDLLNQYFHTPQSQRYDRLIDTKLHQSEINWLLTQLENHDDDMAKTIYNQLSHAVMMDNIAVGLDQYAQAFRDDVKLNQILDKDAKK